MAALLRASCRAFPALSIVRPTVPSLTRAFADAAENEVISYPSDRKYKSSHEWAKVEDGIATVGITNFAQAALGEIVFADLPEIGSEAAAGERAATVESVKAASDIYAPVSGEVVKVNEDLEETPQLINTEPHDGGWLFQLKVSDPSQVEELMDSSAYEKALEEEK